MMKKEYIAPAMEVVEMENASYMMSGSVNHGESVVIRPEDEPEEELSNRRRNFWDEVGRGW